MIRTPPLTHARSLLLIKLTPYHPPPPPPLLPSKKKRKKRKIQLRSDDPLVSEPPTNQRNSEEKTEGRQAGRQAERKAGRGKEGRQDEKAAVIL